MIKNRLGIKLPKQMTETLVSGAGMFIHPVDFSKRPDHKEYNNFCSKCDSTRSHIHLGDGKYKCTYCKTEYYGQWKVFEKGDGRFEDLVFQIPNVLKVDDEFFVQEDFTMWGSNVLYKLDGTASDGFLETVGITWQDASQMSQEQSRYKGIVVDMEVKRVGDMLISEIDKCELGEEFIFDEFPHKDNQYVFLYKIKEIKWVMKTK